MSPQTLQCIFAFLSIFLHHDFGHRTDYFEKSATFTTLYVMELNLRKTGLPPNFSLKEELFNVHDEDTAFFRVNTISLDKNGHIIR